MICNLLGSNKATELYSLEGSNSIWNTCNMVLEECKTQHSDDLELVNDITREVLCYYYMCLYVLT